MARGGKRQGAGRPAGSRTKAKAELQALAQNYTEAGLIALVGIMNDQDTPAAARVSAIKEIFDRGHGKAPQALEHSGPDGKDMSFVVRNFVLPDT